MTPLPKQAPHGAGEAKRVAICGGGVAAIESLLGLRGLLGLRTWT